MYIIAPGKDTGAEGTGYRSRRHDVMRWEEAEGTETRVCCHLMVKLKWGQPYAREGHSQWNGNVKTIRPPYGESRMRRRLTKLEQESGQGMTVAWDRRWQRDGEEEPHQISGPEVNRPI